jgi:hypothetical protein
MTGEIVVKICIIMVASITFMTLINSVSIYISNDTESVCKKHEYKDICQSECGCYWCPYSKNVGSCYSHEYVKYCVGGVSIKNDSDKCFSAERHNLEQLIIWLEVFIASVLFLIYTFVNKEYLFHRLMLLFLSLVLLVAALSMAIFM